MCLASIHAPGAMDSLPGGENEVRPGLPRPHFIAHSKVPVSARLTLRIIPRNMARASEQAPPEAPNARPVALPRSLQIAACGGIGTQMLAEGAL